MSHFEFNYFSFALGMAVTVNAIIPQDAGEREYKTLYLYHGLSDDQTIWQRRTSIERYADNYGIAVVMPNVARSFYTDTAYGMKYFTFVADELPKICRNFFKGMSTKREDNMVAGLSMGGYGAVKVALSRPDEFGYCASLSGALDIAAESRAEMNPERLGNYGFNIKHMDEVRGTDIDCFYLAKKLKAENKPFPKMYIWCGDNDSLLHESEEFSAFLTELGVKHLYEHSEGNHSWEWWDLHIQDALKYFLG